MKTKLVQTLLGLESGKFLLGIYVRDIAKRAQKCYALVGEHHGSLVRAEIFKSACHTLLCREPLCRVDRRQIVFDLAAQSAVLLREYIFF